MNTMQKIAVEIYRTGLSQGWKLGTKTADKLNLEAWRGAAIALAAVEHDDYAHVARVLAFIIVPRGYRETREIAIAAMGGDVAEEFARQHQGVAA